MLFTFFSDAFLYFSLTKAASCSADTHFHSQKLEFFSNLGSDKNHWLFCSLSTYELAFHPCEHGVHGATILIAF